MAFGERDNLLRKHYANVFRTGLCREGGLSWEGPHKGGTTVMNNLALKKNMMSAILIAFSFKNQLKSTFK